MIFKITSTEDVEFIKKIITEDMARESGKNLYSIVTEEMLTLRQTQEHFALIEKYFCNQSEEHSLEFVKIILGYGEKENIGFLPFVEELTGIELDGCPINFHKENGVIFAESNTFYKEKQEK